MWNIQNLLDECAPEQSFKFPLFNHVNRAQKLVRNHVNTSVFKEIIKFKRNVSEKKAHRVSLS